ncbi:MAG: PP2C family serine/threonine-protein phosphatase [Pseudomonadota bacterium]
MDQQYSLHMSGLSDIGRMRERNEDALGWDAARGIAVLADGMGGHRAGDVASRMAVDFILKRLAQELAHTPRVRPNKGLSKYGTVVHRILTKANAHLYAAAHADPAYTGMGTTIVLLVFYRDRVVVAHIGDSRCYRWREGVLQRLTVDHSLLQEMIDQGAAVAPQERARLHNVLTRTLGTQPKVKAEMQELPVAAGDVFLLCSDGLTEQMEDGQIAHILQASAGDEEETTRRLIEAANRTGGADNVSALLVRVAAA